MNTSPARSKRQKPLYMPHEARKYLRDIELAIEKIRSFLPGEYDFDAYDRDGKTQYAIAYDKVDNHLYLLEKEVKTLLGG